MIIKVIFNSLLPGYAYTVGTPYNTTLYITGSNIARLGHGSQNL